MKPFCSCDILEAKLLPTIICHGAPNSSSNEVFIAFDNSEGFVFNVGNSFSVISKTLALSVSDYLK